MPKRLTIKKLINNDPALPKRRRVRYEVSDGWSYPTKAKAKAHIASLKRKKKK